MLIGIQYIVAAGGLLYTCNNFVHLEVSLTRGGIKNLNRRPVVGKAVTYGRAFKEVEIAASHTSSSVQALSFGALKALR